MAAQITCTIDMCALDKFFFHCAIPSFIKAHTSSMHSSPISSLSSNTTALPWKAADLLSRFRCSRTMDRLSCPSTWIFGSYSWNLCKTFKSRVKAGIVPLFQMLKFKVIPRQVLSVSHMLSWPGSEPKTTEVTRQQIYQPLSHSARQWL